MRREGFNVTGLIDAIRSHVMALPDLAKFAVVVAAIVGVPRLAARIGLSPMVGLLLFGVALPCGAGRSGKGQAGFLWQSLVHPDLLGRHRSGDRSRRVRRKRRRPFPSGLGDRRGLARGKADRRGGWSPRLRLRAGHPVLAHGSRRLV
jgi:hypothetical protein